ncbi:MAG TPA: DUF1611 domain-containing protein, partial [Alphaproteobacteria bacterium]|nr:DUF1611 domain-containing protein [Alphaproteobacteria bacterium]
LCHAPGRTTMRGLPDRPMPGLYETLTLNERMARIVCPQARVVGIALNTAHLSDRDAAALIADTAEKQVLPVVDPLRTGVGPLVDAILDL